MKTLSLLVILGASATGIWVGITPSASRTAAKSRMPYDSRWIDVDIANAERMVRVDPQGAIGWSHLCSAYMERSRESDDPVTAIKAEAAARKSLSLRKLGNSAAWNKLCQALLQQHRFKDALAECLAAQRAGIFDLGTTRLQAECLIEIGGSKEATDVVAKHPAAFADASGKTVVARLLDQSGRTSGAVKLLREALAEAEGAEGTPSNVLAWFHGRLAAELEKTGSPDEARSEYVAALDLYPRDYKAMSGLSRLAFRRGNYEEAIRWGNRSDAVAQMPDVRALVADAFAAQGKLDQAELQYARVAALVGRPSGINDGLHEVTPQAGTHGHRLDRQYAMFCADHGRDPEGAYAAAIRDFGARHDLYAYDTLAWVCRFRGDKREARLAIDQALKSGTKDPSVLFHAGRIYADLGAPAKAAGFFRRALAADPSLTVARGAIQDMQNAKGTS